MEPISPASASPADDITGIVATDERDPTVVSLLGLAPGKKARGTRYTLRVILENDARWSRRIRYDSFRQVVVADDQRVDDNELTRIACWIEEVYGAVAATKTIHECLSLIACDHAFHPVLDWAAKLRWDGVERLPGVLTTYFGAPDDELTRAMSTAWLIGGAARVVNPGCKLDTMLVLVGAQGAGKSTACRALMPDPTWFADTTLDLRSKDAMHNLVGIWLYEIAELEGFRGRNVEGRIKAYLSSEADTFRVPYGHFPGRSLRQCFFVGTTNEVEFLNDRTGSRRFWPVHVSRVDVAGIRLIRDQLWAEAFARHARAERWHLPAHLEGARAQAAEEFERLDPMADRLATWVTTVGRSFSAEEAIEGGYGLPVQRVDHALLTKLGTTLHRLGCKKHRPRGAKGNRSYVWDPPRLPSEKS